MSADMVGGMDMDGADFQITSGMAECPLHAGEVPVRPYGVVGPDGGGVRAGADDVEAIRPGFLINAVPLALPGNPAGAGSDREMPAHPMNPGLDGFRPEATGSAHQWIRMGAGRNPDGMAHRGI